MARRDGPVVVSGWYGHGNSGDEAILSVLVDQLRAMGVSDIHVLTTAPEAVTRDYGARGVTGVREVDSWGIGGAKNLLNGALLAKLRHLRGARAFVFGGGSLLRDNGSRANLFRLLDDIFIASACGAPVFFYALGAGPFATGLGRRLIAAAARRATVITLRDARSAERLAELGLPRERLRVVADPALLLDDVPPEPALRRAGIETLAEGDARLLFVYPTVSMTMEPLAPGDDRHLRRLAAALDVLHAEDGYTPVFVPMWLNGTARDDVAISERIRGHMAHAGAARIIRAALTPEEIRAITAVPAINLTVRLHAMIYAASRGVPCVALNYEPKVLGNAERLGLADHVVDFTDHLADATVAAVRRLAAAREREAQALAERLPGLKAEARETFTLLRRMLDAP